MGYAARKQAADPPSQPVPQSFSDGHLPEHQAQRIDVRAGIGFLALELLRQELFDPAGLVSRQVIELRNRS